MSIHFISGKPGGGKTLYSVKLIIDELVHGHRLIVTNVPLKLDRINEYLQTRHEKAYGALKMAVSVQSGELGSPVSAHERQCIAEETRHITNRILIIGDDDMARFFTFRGNGVRLESVSNEDWRKGVRPDFKTVNDVGIFYVLDEIHIAFNSRAWALTGNEVLYYLSQHRKLGDDVVCITQSVSNVDKQFRSVAQDYTYIRNLSKQRAGLFKLPYAFLRSTYAQPATDNSKAMETGMFRLDVTGLASCYDTAQGVGIHGRAGADTTHKRKGIHWLWAVVVIPLVIYLFIHFAPRFIVHGLNPHIPQAEKKASSRFVGPGEISSGKKTFNAGLPQTVVAPGETVSPGEVDSPVGPEIFCRGYMLGKYPQVYLSDGRVADAQYGEVQSIMRHSVIAFNHEFKIRPAEQPVYERNESSQNPWTASASVPAYSDNPVQVLPGIHGQSPEPSPRLNGISRMPGQPSSFGNHSGFP